MLTAAQARKSAELVIAEQPIAVLRAIEAAIIGASKDGRLEMAFSGPRYDTVLKVLEFNGYKVAYHRSRPPESDFYEIAW